MDKKDWIIFSEFKTLLDLERFSLILRHDICGAVIRVNLIPAPPTLLSLRDINLYAVNHKKNECKRLQGLKANITIFDEVDSG